MSRTTRARETPFAQWLMSNREARGLSMRALAEKVDVTHAHISKLEAGSQPSREMVRRLAQCLTPEGGDEDAERRLLQEGLRAAFGIDEEYQYPTVRDLTHSIIREAGYDERSVTEEELEGLRRGQIAFTKAYLEQRREERGE